MISVIYFNRAVGLILGLGSLLMAAATAHAQNDEGLRKSFFSDAPIAWKSLDDQFHNRSYVANLSLTIDGKPKSSLTNTFKANRGMRLAITEREIGGGWSARAYLVAPGKCYGLERTSRDRPWVLTDVVQGDELPPASQQVLKEMQRGHVLVRSVFNSDLMEMAKRNTFRVTHAKLANVGDKQLVSIGFVDQTDPPSTVGPPNIIVSGTVLLDPSSMWCVVKGECIAKYADGDVQIQFQNTYADRHPGDVPDLVRSEAVRRQIADRHQSHTLVNVTEISWQKKGVQPDPSEFGLDVFGIKIPNDPKEDRGGRVKWLVLCGVAVCGLLWQRKRIIGS